MANTIADQFIDALNALEGNRDVNPLAVLFTENAEVGNVLVPEKFHGPAGARDFWTKYRDNFESLQSTFRNKIIQENLVALEWTTTGSSPHGEAVEYEGVSILEIAGGKISRFQAYFDPAALGRQLVTGNAQSAQG